MPVVHVVDVANATRDEIGVVARVLAEHDDEAFVPLILHGGDLLANLIHAERTAYHVFVLALKAAVGTVVHAQVAEVERREQHNPVAVHTLFQIARGREDLLAHFGIARAHQHGGLLDGERLFVQRLGDDLAEAPHVDQCPRTRQTLQVGILDEILGVATECLR